MSVCNTKSATFYIVLGLSVLILLLFTWISSTMKMKEGMDNPSSHDDAKACSPNDLATNMASLKDKISSTVTLTGDNKQKIQQALNDLYEVANLRIINMICQTVGSNKMNDAAIENIVKSMHFRDGLLKTINWAKAKSSSGGGIFGQL